MSEAGSLVAAVPPACARRGAWLRSRLRAWLGAWPSAWPSVWPSVWAIVSRGAWPNAWVAGVARGWPRVPRAFALAIVVVALQPRAWDADRMLAAAEKHGPRALAGARALQGAMQSVADVDEEASLAGLNQFFNRRIQAREDAEVWGKVDYWASPLELLERGAGDCEDFAIAKYFSLAALGVPVQKLRLVYVRAQIGGAGGPSQAHMVLAYYATPNAEPLIMDNLITDVRPASRRPDLTPVFSFNTEGLWQGVGSQSGGDATARLSRWREVLAKALAEGFR